MTLTKLVRDKIPGVIREAGLQPIMRVAEADEYARLLREKLREEVQEFLESGEPEELADVIEVVFALRDDLGLTADELEGIRLSKRADHGAFAARLVWEGNITQSEL